MQHQRGFTIAELIIVVIIAAVLAAVAVPNLSEFVKDNSRATRVNTMVTALNYARGQAVTRNARVSICKSAGFVACDAAGGGNFENGWMVFTDHIPAFAGGTVGTIDTGVAGFADEFRAIASYFGPFKDEAMSESDYLIRALVDRP